MGKNKLDNSALGWCNDVTAITELGERPRFSLPFLVNDVFEQDVLHMAIAETAEHTGHSRPLRNPLALSVCSEKHKTDYKYILLQCSMKVH